jgi:phosphonate transport system substrate-binding protein
MVARHVARTASTADVRRRALLRLGSAVAWTGGWCLVQAQERPIVIGVTPVLLEDRLRLWRRWAAYLSHACGVPVQLRSLAGYNRVVEALRQGSLDAAWLCGYPYVLHRDTLALLAVPLWQGQPSYRAYVIVREEQPSTRWDDLRGSVFAFSDPLSNSGHLVVRAHLLEQGQTPETFFARTFFTHAHRHVVEAVREGLAHAGAVDGYVWEWLRAREPSRVRGTRVLWQSQPYAFPPVVAGPALSAGRKHVLTRALLGMADNPEGAHVLRELQLDGFVVGQSRWYEPIARMARRWG